LVFGGFLLALASCLVFATPAPASPVLSVELIRAPAVINRGDEFVSYEAKVVNASPSDSTAGPLELSLQLPEGLTLAAASGSEWSCVLAAKTCSSSKEVGPGAAYPTLELSQIWIDEAAPDHVVIAVTASGGGASEVTATDSFALGPPTPFGFHFVDTAHEDEAGQPFTRAGGHPYATSFGFDLTMRNSPTNIHVPVEDLRMGVSALPTGLVANPTAAKVLCDFTDLLKESCPTGAAVGQATFDISAPEEAEDDVQATIYQLPPERGFPAALGVRAYGASFVLRTKIRSDGDYGINMALPPVPQSPQLYAASFTLCGYGAKVDGGGGSGFLGCRKGSEVIPRSQAFITLGTDCSAGPPLTRFVVDSWIHPGRPQADGLPDLGDPNWVVRDFSSPPLTGCEVLTEEWTDQHRPSFAIRSDVHASDSPAAYTAHLHIPQDGLEDPNGVATSQLKDLSVSLPAGVSLNPSLGGGLGACSAQQIGLLGTNFPPPSPLRFNTEAPDCPPNSRLGSVTLSTPILDKALHGSIFLAAQDDNPFGSDFAVYLTIDEPDLGVVVKRAGKVEADPVTGRIRATFRDNPQLPFSDLELSFFSGQRSVLANPPICGSFAANIEATPWSAKDPYRPEVAEIARPADQIAIDSGPRGAPCAASPSELPFALAMAAGSRDPVAAVASPFSFDISRPDGSQTIDHLTLTPPPGFVASLKGIPYCSAGEIEAARRNSGGAERRSPSCSENAQVGTIAVGLGAGSSPFHAPGKLYLAGPYGGAPVSIVAIAPALAGPLDLGTVVVRAALQVDPETLQLSAWTDPIPRILKGVPLRIRDVRVDLDRADWARNPTDCDATVVQASASGAAGASAALASRFQVGGCARLPFTPKLRVRMGGGTGRNGHPVLTVKLTQPAGQANVAGISVVLPRSELLAQSHIRAVCTRLQFERDACPPASVYGYAEAESPLLDRSLTGPVYLRSSNHKLPDLVAALKGPKRQPIEVNLVGRVDSVGGQIRTSFRSVPDAPVSRFVFRMKGGGKGLLVNSRDLCAGPHRAGVRLVGQNGKRVRHLLSVSARCASGTSRSGGR
jgi:hypothetical protein